MPGKKMALFVAIIIIGGFFGVQAMFGFPIKDLIRSDVTDQEKVITKSEGTWDQTSIPGVSLIVRLR